MKTMGGGENDMREGGTKRSGVRVGGIRAKRGKVKCLGFPSVEKESKKKVAGQPGSEKKGTMKREKTKRRQMKRK